MRKLNMWLAVFVLVAACGISSTAFAHHEERQTDLIQVEALINELDNMPDEQATVDPAWFEAGGLLAPIGSLEKTQVTLLTFLGLLAILTLRVFFHMHEKKRRDMRNARAMEMNSLSHGGSYNESSWKVHRQSSKKVRRSRNKSTASFEQMHCSTMFERQPRHVKRYRVNF